jgi:hypothetical protein
MQFALDLDAALDPRALAIDALHRATAIYTNDGVIDALLDRIGWPDADGALIDPSAGDGAFLARAIERIDTPRHDRGSLDRIEGWEIHPEAVAEGRARIAQILVRRDWSPARAAEAAAAVLRHGDFILDRTSTRRYRFVAGNPPYIRYGHLPDWFKDLYRDALPDFARGDLLHGFLDRCVDLMSDDGVVGLVTSDRWLFNQTAADLRAQIGRRAGIAHLARLDPETSFYQPKSRRRGTPPRIHPVEVVLRPEGPDHRALTRAPISLSNTPEERGAIALGDIATIKIAPWLGPKGIFVVDAATAARLPQSCLIPCVDTDDVDPSTNRLRDPQRFAIRTTRDHEPEGVLREHLRREIGRMPKRGQGKLWWMPPETITLPLDRPALMIPRIGKTLRAIELPSGVLPINHNLYVIQTQDGWPLERVKAAVESDRTQAWLRDNAPPLENGYYDCRAGVIRRIPIA